MDLNFTEEQQMLRDTVRGLCAEHAPVEVVRTMEDDPIGFPAPLWKQLGELGVTGITLPEAYGGGGQSALEAMIVYYVAAILLGKLVKGNERDRSISEDIYEGSLTRYLLYPSSYIAFKYAEHLGSLLPAFVEQIANMFRPQASAKGVAFQLETPKQLPEFVRGDQKRLRQVLINLISNAIKFTPAGSVTFRIGWRGEIATFEVIDTGIGIAPEHLDRVFERFYQVDPARTGFGGRGTGLGLAIVKHAIYALSGTVKLTSAVGKGTPRRRPSSTRRARARASRSPNPAPAAARKSTPSPPM